MLKQKKTVVKTAVILLMIVLLFSGCNNHKESSKGGVSEISDRDKVLQEREAASSAVWKSAEAALIDDGVDFSNIVTWIEDEQTQKVVMWYRQDSKGFAEMLGYESLPEKLFVVGMLILSDDSDIKREPLYYLVAKEENSDIWEIKAPWNVILE